MITSEDLYTEEGEYEDLEVVEENEDNAEAPTAENENEEEESTKKEVKPKRIRNPHVLLTAETLKQNRGLAALPSYFERVKYKGNGHEEEDLSVILKTYEYWCHRMFPRYPFDDCIARMEKLGTKRAVVTQIKRIRFDLQLPGEIPSTINEDNDAPIDSHDSDDDGHPEPHTNDFPEASTPSHEFDNLRPLLEQTEPTPQVNEISEEQLEQIRLNREQALKRRQERIARHKQLEESVAHTSAVGDEDTPSISLSFEAKEATVSNSPINDGSEMDADDAGSN